MAICRKNSVILFLAIVVIMLLSSKNAFTEPSTSLTAPGRPMDAGEYRNSTIVWFAWTGATDPQSDITGYILQVGTTPGGRDLFEGNIGTALEYNISAKHGQTVYARVAAVNAEGLQGPWSESSDGIEVRDPTITPAALFVSPTGDDSKNNGRSDSSPFKTIGKAVEIAESGDIISVGEGEYPEQVFINKSGTAGDPIVIRADGEVLIQGAKPLTGPWTDHGVQTSGCRLWSTPFDPALHPGLEYYGEYNAPTQLFLDNQQLSLLPKPESFNNGFALLPEETQDLTLIMRQIEPGTWFWLNQDHGPEMRQRVFVCLSENDPVTEHLVEIPVRNAAFIATGSHIEIRGFSAEKQSLCGIAVLGGPSTEGITVAENTVKWISGARSYRGNDLRNAKIVWEAGYGIIVRVFKRAVVMNNIVRDVSYRGIKALISNKFEKNWPGYLHIKGNIVQNISPHPFGVNGGHEGGEGISGTNGSTHNVIEENVVSNVRFGIWFDSSFGGSRGTGHSVVRANTVQDVVTAIFFERSAFECTALRNLIKNARNGIKLGTGSQIEQEEDLSNPVYDSRRHRIIHNTITDTIIGINLDYTRENIVKNNIIAQVNRSQGIGVGIRISEATLTLASYLSVPIGDIDYNLYNLSLLAPYTAIGCWGRMNDTNCDFDLERWQSRSSEEFGIHSLERDPEFKDPSLGDYSLSANSAAIDAGVDLMLGDYEGAPDIGAFERYHTPSP